MRLLQKILFPALLVATLFSACKKVDKDDTPERTSHKVVFKAVVSAGVELHVIGYGYDAELTYTNNITGNTWTNPEITVPASANSVDIRINATSESSTATAKVQIYVDDQLKKEATATGTVLVAGATYTF